MLLRGEPGGTSHQYRSGSLNLLYGTYLELENAIIQIDRTRSSLMKKITS